jgi:hypothetical protein
MIRSRKPLYHRLLRLRQLRPGSLATFVLFEGSILVALLLALAEIIDPWGVAAIPVAVAVMVKLNDVITVVLRRPVAAAQLDRPRLAGGPAIGVSARPPTAHLTRWISGDDAVADPAARPGPTPFSDRDGVVRGIASVPQPDRNESGPAPRARPDGAEYRRRDRGNQGRFDSAS